MESQPKVYFVHYSRKIWHLMKAIVLTLAYLFTHLKLAANKKSVIIKYCKRCCFTLAWV